ncbi:MAG: hypothetical protein WCY93_09400 [Anaerolineaceae bacterium]|nr:hypothetical protein [Brevefilum sp.]
MTDDNKIYFKDWNPESRMTEPTGEVVSIYAVARSITPLNFAKLFDNYLNLGGKGANDGRLVGLHLRNTHRTLQRLAVCFALGLIMGLSEQEHTDARNETAVETAKKIAQLIKDGELPTGMYL